MNGHFPATLLEPERPRFENCETDTRDLFRAEFKRAISRCVRRGFSVEESFGMIWEETLETVPLTDPNQAKLYGELITWAKQMDMTSEARAR